MDLSVIDAKNILAASDQHSRILQGLQSREWAVPALKRATVEAKNLKTSLVKLDANIRRLDALRVSRAARRDGDFSLKRSLNKLTAFRQSDGDADDDSNDDYMAHLAEARRMQDQRPAVEAKIAAAERVRVDCEAVVRERATLLEELDALHQAVLAEVFAGERAGALGDGPASAAVMNARAAVARIEEESETEAKAFKLLNAASQDVSSAAKCVGGAQRLNEYLGGVVLTPLPAQAYGWAHNALQMAQARRKMEDASEKIEAARELQPLVSSIASLVRDFAEQRNDDKHSSTTLDNAADRRTKDMLAIHQAMPRLIQESKARQRSLAAELRQERQKGEAARIELRRVRIRMFRGAPGARPNPPALDDLADLNLEAEPEDVDAAPPLYSG